MRLDSHHSAKLDRTTRLVHTADIGEPETGETTSAYCLQSFVLLETLFSVCYEESAFHMEASVNAALLLQLVHQLSSDVAEVHFCLVWS